jgi:hypothetical protein
MMTTTTFSKFDSAMGQRQRVLVATGLLLTGLAVVTMLSLTQGSIALTQGGFMLASEKWCGLG